jgi:DNA-binding response OmpR family regulator
MIILPNPSQSELVARIKALFRRQHAMGQTQISGQIQAHGLMLDPLTRSVQLHGQDVDLTPREFELLWFCPPPWRGIFASGVA